MQNETPKEITQKPVLNVLCKSSKIGKQIRRAAHGALVLRPQLARSAFLLLD